MGAVASMARQQLRRRWASAVGLALLLGLAGGVVLSTAAGARRTSDVYDRFVAATATRDVQLQIDVDEPDPFLDAVEALDLVAASGRVQFAPVAPDPDDVDTEELDMTLVVSPDGRWGTDVDRPLMLDGRMADPDSLDEVVINEVTANQTGLEVGDRITVTSFTPEALRSVLGGGEFLGFAGPELDLEVVGIGRQATDLQGADITAGAMLLGTPALAARLDGRAGILGGMVGIALRDGTSPREFRSAVSEVVGDVEYDLVFARDEFASSTRDATKVLANALWAFATAAAAAGIVAVGGALSRACAGGRDTGDVLEALGCTHRQRIAAVSTIPLAGLLGGTVVAVVAAVLASERFPISMARRVEPSPGVELDGVVLGTGALAIVLTGSAWSWWAATRDRTPRQALLVRSPMWRRVGAALPVVGSIAATHAFQRHGDGRAVSVRTALAAVTVGVLGVVATATVVRSLDELVDEPRRYGWGWSAEPDVYSEDLEGIARSIVGTDGVDAVAVRDTRRVELDGVVLDGHAVEVEAGEVGFPIRTGRTPGTDTELALGAHSADALGVGIGDIVAALPAAGNDPVRLTVVGTAVFPTVDSTDAASGALLTPDGLEAVARSGGFRSLLLSYEPGADQAAVESLVMEAHPETVDYSIYSRPRLPGSLENLRRAMPIVGWLGGFVAVLGIAGLAHGVFTGTRRRRRELATLRALGLRRRQVRAVVAGSAIGTATAGAVLGVPLGLVLGRGTWDLVIGGHGLLDATAVPIGAVLAVPPAAFLAAVAVSWWPGRQAAAAPPADLRSE